MVGVLSGGRMAGTARLLSALALTGLTPISVSAQRPADTQATPGQSESVPAPLFAPPANAPVHFGPPPTEPGMRPAPIDLPTALRLANTRAIDIDVASARIRVASAL